MVSLLLGPCAHCENVRARIRFGRAIRSDDRVAGQPGKISLSLLLVAIKKDGEGSRPQLSIQREEQSLVTCTVAQAFHDSDRLSDTEAHATILGGDGQPF